MKLDCLRVVNGPTLQFNNGVLSASGAAIGAYNFLPAVPGKHGPRIHVAGIQVRKAANRILIESGKEEWFWTFQDDDTVEIFFYPQDRAVARRCGVSA